MTTRRDYRWNASEIWIKLEFFMLLRDYKLLHFDWDKYYRMSRNLNRNKSTYQYMKERPSTWGFSLNRLFVKPFTCTLFRDTLFSSFNHLDFLSLGLMFRKPIIIGNPDGFSIVRQVCVQNSGNNIIIVVKGSQSWNSFLPKFFTLLEAEQLRGTSNFYSSSFWRWQCWW